MASSPRLPVGFRQGGAAFKLPVTFKHAGVLIQKTIVGHEETAAPVTALAGGSSNRNRPDSARFDLPHCGDPRLRQTDGVGSTREVMARGSRRWGRSKKLSIRAAIQRCGCMSRSTAEPFRDSSVPSGASTGEHEATELRDGDAARYQGKGVRNAVNNVNTEIARLLAGRNPSEQGRIDRALIDLDGTENKSRLGANAILGASQAVARAAALSHGLPLYAYLGGAGAVRLPTPMMNVLNGGKHAENPRLPGIHDHAGRRAEFGGGSALRCRDVPGAQKILSAKGYATSVGDEGGFAPQLRAATMRPVRSSSQRSKRPAIGPARTSPSRSIRRPVRFSKTENIICRVAARATRTAPA